MEVFFGGKSSLRRYGLSLQSMYRTPAVRKRYLYSVPGGDGQVDLMKGMGPPRYEQRTIRFTFKLCGADPKGDMDRVVNELEGQTVEIVLPGDLEYYMVGDIHISSAAVKAGGEVVIVATCQPWRYLRNEVLLPLPAAEDYADYILQNKGTRDAVPKLVAYEQIKILKDGVETICQPGNYYLTDYVIPGQGSVTLTVCGGAANISYKEAIL